MGERRGSLTLRAPTDGRTPAAPFTFVTDGVVAAVEQARVLAGDRNVSVAAGDVVGSGVAAGVTAEMELRSRRSCSALGSDSSATTPGPTACSTTRASSSRVRRVTHA